MREVHFFKLPRPIQDRFLGATRGELPAPLLMARIRSLGQVAWLVAAGACALAEALVVALGYGELQHALALQPPSMVALHIVLAALIVFCVAAWLLRARYAAQLPFRRRIYLFPASVVDATRPVFRVYDASEYRAVEVSGARVLVTTEAGKRFEFKARTASEAEAIGVATEKGRQRFESAKAESNRRELALLDPLVDSGFSSPFSPQTPLRSPRPVPLWLVGVGALAVGALLGGTIWKLRNQRSETALYRAAVLLDTPEGYRAYLARGGVRQDVRDQLLPRALLRKVHASGDLEAMERYEAAHRGSKIAAEVDAVHRDLLLKELNALMKMQSPKALAQFEKTRKRVDLVGKELGYAKRSVYTAAHKKYLASAADPGGEVAGFIGAALDFAREHSPTVELRFRRRMAGSLVEIEKAVVKSRYYLGSKLLPRQYFTTEDARRREQRVAQVILSALQQGFSEEVLDFELGAPVADDEELPPVKVPTIFVDRRVQLSGLFPNLNPRGIFVGMGVLYEVKLLLPGQSEVVEMKFSTWKQPDRKALEGPDPAVEKAYEGPMAASLDRFAEWLMERFYAPTPKSAAR